MNIHYQVQNQGPGDEKGDQYDYVFCV